MNTNALYEIPPVSLLEPNDSAQGNPDSLIRLRELIDTEAFREISDPLTVPVGVDSARNPVFFDIAKMPHLLIAGRTGAGKSMWIHTVITGLLCKKAPDKIHLILIDPKMTEFDAYNALPHLTVHRLLEGADALDSAINEMNRRIYLNDNHWTSRIVIIIDELADLMMTASEKVEKAICRLAERGHTVGIHLILATQCPRPDVVPEPIKAVIPSRIAFAVASEEDSRYILDTGGAETLNGQGDMLFAPVDAAKPIRLQGAYVSGREIERIVNFIKDQILGKAIELALEEGKISTALIQRRLHLGYRRAVDLIDEMYERGIVSAPNGQNPRTAHISKQYLETVQEQSKDLDPSET